MKTKEILLAMLISFILGCILTFTITYNLLKPKEVIIQPTETQINADKEHDKTEEMRPKVDTVYLTVKEAVNHSEKVVENNNAKGAKKKESYKTTDSLIWYTYNNEFPRK
ncbi:MAG: hypothetical protein ABI241_00390 [Bacteroidia bacterium]